MFARKITISSLFLTLLLMGCSEKSAPVSDSSVSTTKNKGMNKSEENASLNCEGKSFLELLYINGAQIEVDNESCFVRRFGSGEQSGLMITFSGKDEGVTVMAQFHLFGVEEFIIKPAEYEINNAKSEKYGKIFLESGNPKEIQEINNYSGVVKILDYGQSSNVVCGVIDLKDEKGNKLQGKFYESISTF